MLRFYALLLTLVLCQNKQWVTGEEVRYMAAVLEMAPEDDLDNGGGDYIINKNADTIIAYAAMAKQQVKIHF